MSNISGASSGVSNGGRDRGKVMGIPRRCWCGEEIITKISRSDSNPYQRYFRCSLAVAKKLSNDNHVFKWVDEALLNEIEAFGYRAESIEHQMKELSKSRLELEKMVYDKMEMKLQNEIFEKVEEIIGETESKMKKMMVLAVFGCVAIVGFSMLLG
ncbi:uncharacterized protein At4g04775-like [Eutrema salsugineum]|uniref:uncharacterized protein At4g04775-like n=1 Tax=Eutrema salsugineum TaxID=72664 RepID=UPI000CED34BA|nr:uncharacterized protein At4g04775-like [Eutrema salsugineum]